MSLDLQQISPELKTLLLDLKNLSPMHRFAVVSRPREELKWKTVAAVYGIEKLEANRWIIPEEELENRATSPSSPTSPTSENQNQSTAEGAEDPEREDPAALEARMEQEKAEGVRRAIELNAQVDKRYGAWGAEPIPPDVQLSKLPNFNPDYVLAGNGRVEHVITVQHELEKTIREKLGVPEAWRPATQKIAWHKEQLRRLEKADHAPRCEHVYMDGTGCRAPKLKEGRLCYAHERMERVKPKKLRLLPPEDANAIVVNLMEISRALVDDEISERKAGLLMYQQQLALIALKQVTFKTTNPALMVREMPMTSGDRVIGRSGDRNGKTPVRHRSAQNDADQDKALTAKDAESAKESGEQRQNGCATSAQPAQAGVPVPHNPKDSTSGSHRTAATLAAPGTPGLNPVSRLDSGLTGINGGGRGTPDESAELQPRKPKSASPGIPGDVAIG